MLLTFTTFAAADEGKYLMIPARLQLAIIFLWAVPKGRNQKT